MTESTGGTATPESPESAAAGPGRLRLVDALASTYNVLLALVWAMLIPQWSFALWLFLAHAAAAALPRLLDRAGDDLSPFGRVLSDIYPLLWVLPFWTELDFIRPLLHDAAFDRVVGAFDLLVFRTHLDEIWMPAMPMVWFSEIMYLAYLSYYPIVVIPLVYTLAAGSREMKRDMTLRVTLVYYACFVVYIAFPVDGPHFLSEHYEGALQNGLFYRIDAFLQGGGASLGASFPSSHVAASVTMACLGFRWFSRPVAVTLSVGALGVSLAIFYTQNHWAIDSVTGILWALWLNVMVAPVLLRWWRCERGTAASG
jgi:membrane-associated phospholipid phosphatase